MSHPSTRRTALALCALLLPGSLAALPAADAPTAPAKPNILLILADDFGWADAPWHGSPARMPHLEKLAAEGVRLEAHYVHPMCSPTRAALLSGRYASRFGVTAAQNQRAYSWHTLTLPGELKTAGYETALMGKWHLGSKPVEGPQKFGFDYSYGSLAGGVTPYSHRYIMRRSRSATTIFRGAAIKAASTKAASALPPWPSGPADSNRAKSILPSMRWIGCPPFARWLAQRPWGTTAGTAGISGPR